MTRIYLIRHAEAEGNLYRIAQGQGNSNLTDRGWRQVEALSKRFMHVPVDAVYASDLYRTCATASALYRPKGLLLHRWRQLREIHVGQWECRPWGEIAREDRRQIENFMRHPQLWRVPGAERPEQVLVRMKEAMAEIARENPGKTVAAVSHAYAIRLLLGGIEGRSLEEIGQTSLGGNTAVSLLEVDAEDMQVVFRDDVTHLQTTEYLSEEKDREKPKMGEDLWYVGLDQLPAAKVVWPKEIAGYLEKEEEGCRTIAACLGEEAAGVMQLGPQPGWISLLWIRPDLRRRGLGQQMLGQAVLWAREQGSEALQAVPAEEDQAQSFLRRCGFSREKGVEGSDKAAWKKYIGFDPEILG